MDETGFDYMIDLLFSQDFKRVQTNLKLIDFKCLRGRSGIKFMVF